MNPSISYSLILSSLLLGSVAHGSSPVTSGKVGGSKVEIVAIYRDSDKGPWWRADGTRYSKRPIPADPAFSFLESKKAIVVSVKVTADQCPSLDFWNGATRSGTSRFPNANTPKDGKGFWYASAMFVVPQGARDLSLRVRSAASKWTTVSQVKRKGTQLICSGLNIHPKFHDEKRKGSMDTRGNSVYVPFVSIDVELPQSLKSQATRLVALDAKGRLIAEGLPSLMNSDPLPFNFGVFADGPKIARFELQTRPFEAFDFPHLSVEPKR